MNDIGEFAGKEGKRVQLQPATDSWMSGDRFGTIEKVGRKMVHIKMDRSGKTKIFYPANVLEFVD